jgi:chaperone modulatory protein CbpM
MAMHDEADMASRLSGVTRERLQIWIRRGWIRPVLRAGGPRFTDADVARASLIHDLREIIGLDDEAVPVVLNLIDQIHGLRRELKDLLTAIDQQSDDVRQSVRSHLLKRHSRSMEM